LAKSINDSAIYNHLRFTVLGAWIKLKLWDMFHALFLDQEITSGEGAIGQVTAVSGRELTVAEFISGCRAAVLEDAVLPKQLRTEDEHRRIVMVAATSSSSSSSSSVSFGTSVNASGWEDVINGGLNRAAFAEHARLALHRSQRDAWLLREVRRGDLVWGLYSGACEWLPAVVSACNEDGTFDLRYLMTEDEILAVRKATVARKLLFVPEDQIVLEPMQAATEGELAGRIFDIIDSQGESVGLLSVRVLMEQLRSTRFDRIVRSSAALSLLVQFEAFDFGSAFAGYISSFGAAARNETGEDANFFTRLQFVEFCSVLSDIRSFNFSG